MSIEVQHWNVHQKNPMDGLKILSTRMLSSHETQ